MDYQPGTRVGAYEIRGPLGSGGMGEVYRARDTRLGRDVAIKVLPARVSHDPARLARFDREARLLAAMNHPGIGSIYGLEEHDGSRLLILELVPGETLAERIARGPLTAADAISIGRQIADACAFAHASGVVHRDLKPANIKCTPSGAVKVLDFGLAKLMGGDPESRANDPTMAVETHDGAILGTPGYMSPEQARGEAVDRRADVWSLGCVLFEMLTGRSPFRRKTVTDTLAAIVSQDPDWSALPASTPPALRALLARCLRRDKERRLHDMNDVRLELDEALAARPAAGDAAMPAESRALAVVATIVVLASAAMVAVFFKDLIPPLVTMYEDLGLALEPAFGMYIRASNIGGVIVIVLALVVVVVVVAGRRIPIARRRTLLIGALIASSAWTILGLYFVAQHGVAHAMRLHLAIRTQLIQSDLVALDLAGGRPADAIAIADPSKAREKFDGRAALAFQLAEAYRQAGDPAAARALYRRAQELATRFDEETSQRLLATEDRWEKHYDLGGANVGITTWGPRVSDVGRLPALVRTLAQQRLDQIAR